MYIHLFIRVPNHCKSPSFSSLLHFAFDSPFSGNIPEPSKWGLSPKHGPVVERCEAPASKDCWPLVDPKMQGPFVFIPSTRTFQGVRLEACAASGAGPTCMAVLGRECLLFAIRV